MKTKQQNGASIETGEQEVAYVPSGEGESVWVLGDTYTFKATSEDTDGTFALWETTTPPQTDGPPPHIHHREDESFYVLEGEVELQTGDRTIRASAGSFIYIPRGTLHTFKNAGTTPARFVATVTPGGFEEFFMEVGKPAVEGSTSPEGPPDVEEVVTTARKYDCEIPLHPENGVHGEVTHHLPGEGRALWMVDALVTVKVDSSDTGGAFSFFESLGPPGGGGPPPHTHREKAEAYYVLEGEVEFILNKRTVRAEAGSFIYIPPGNVHGYTSVGETPAKVLFLDIPGGFEGFFEELGEPAKEKTLPPPEGPPDVERMVEVGHRYDTEFLPPPEAELRGEGL